MTAATVTGLAALRRRLAAKGLDEALERTLASEAEAIAAEAARAAPGRLGDTLETVNESKGDRLAFAVGTPHRAGRFVEFGTRHMPAKPFLWPIFRARLPRIKQDITNSLRARLAKQ